MSWIYDRIKQCYVFQEGGIISARKGWEVVTESTNRYNKNHDHYLDLIEELSRTNGFNDYLIAAMIANAIHENQGSPLATASNGRVGLWQGDKRQAAYMGNTVESNVRAFKLDYDHGTWYNTYDKNGWNPRYHKIFKDADNVDDATFGMAAGYERFKGSNDRNNSEVKSRQRTARLIYRLISLVEEPTPKRSISTENSAEPSKSFIENVFESITLFGQSPWGYK